MNTVYLLLGSNEGRREDWLNKAIDLLTKDCGKVAARSAIYETAAWGKEDQPDFLNMAVAVETELNPREILECTQAIEQQLGRQRTEKWGRRTLDIDILFYDGLVVSQPDLQIPHPYIQERRFALAPLAEIAPELLHPVFRRTITQLLSGCTDPLEVRRLTR
ncbi:MAG: 2-amino-4-hydroxy-6-hydroxymethyldihydropteridine diphosphokinase [Bacteroidetes bacterium]|nr:2-amino-4-hydroxy-6-hydroxymethyldihydropteridine diphosphokinase [Bacteroidota bacterium]